jgi:hypothetical protein
MSRTETAGIRRMNRPHFSIRFLLLTVLLFGVAIAALTHPSELWDSLLFSGYLAILHVAIVGMILCRGCLRAFWIASSVFGWGYLILSSGPWISQPIRPRLISESILVSLYPRLISLPPGVDLTNSGILVGDMNKLNSVDVFNSSQAQFRQFKDIGHLLTGLILALVGGYVSWFLVSRKDRSSSATPPS